MWDREVLVAEVGGCFSRLYYFCPALSRPFAEIYPELSDFNVFEPFQNQGIGNLLMEEAEKRVKHISDKVTLGVGLHSGYGPAQRLYIKRDYIPDGSGVWYQNHQPAMNAVCEDIGDLVLYLSKRFDLKIDLIRFNFKITKSVNPFFIREDFFRRKKIHSMKR